MKRFVITALVIGVLSGCTGAAPTKAPASVPSATSNPTSTPVPSATPSPTSTANPTAKAPTPASTRMAPSPAFPALTEQFTSDIHGISVSYPAGWHVHPATEPWTSLGNCEECPYTDVIYKQETDSPFIAVASQPLGDSTYEEWAARQFQVYVDDDPACDGFSAPITIDGSPGDLEDPCMVAFTSAAGRGYLIWLYRDDNRVFFEEILDSVDLHPEDAVDQP